MSVTGRIVVKGARVVTDGLGCFRGVADAGCEHQAIVTVLNVVSVAAIEVGILDHWSNWRVAIGHRRS